MDLRQLTALLAVAEEGSFTAAARRLHLVQSSLSQQIKGLEEELGVALFVRERAGARLTRAGEEAVRAVRRVFEDLEGLRGVRRLAAGGAPQLRIGCITGALGRWVQEVITRTRRLRPDVLIRLTEARSDTIVALLQSGQLDAGIGGTPPEPPGTVVVPLYEESLMALAPAGSPLAAEPALALSRLAAVPLVVYPPGHGLRRLVDAAFARRGIQPVLALEVESSRLICEAVEQGFGVALVTENFVRNHRSPALAAVPLRDRRLRRRVVLLLRRSDGPRPGDGGGDGGAGAGGGAGEEGGGAGEEGGGGPLGTFTAMVREVLAEPGAVVGTVLLRPRRASRGRQAGPAPVVGGGRTPRHAPPAGRHAPPAGRGMRGRQTP
jgi:DNA-binding transcriptional LysR family regulator